MKWVIFGLVAGVILLQIRLWTGEGSFLQVRALQKEVALQEEKVAKLTERNRTLEAEVQDLKLRSEALEERARTDLGMVRRDETFFQYSKKNE